VQDFKKGSTYADAAGGERQVPASPLRGGSVFDGYVGLRRNDGKEMVAHSSPARRPASPQRHWQGDDWKSGGGRPWMTGNYDRMNLVYWGIGKRRRGQRRESRRKSLNQLGARAPPDPDSGKSKAITN